MSILKSREIKKFRKTYTKYEKTCVFEGYKLAVLFDEKDDVKRYGGRWDPEEMTWWMPEKKLLNEIHNNGTLVRDWLNDSEMIMGQYGKIQWSKDDMKNISYTQYTLHCNTGERNGITVNWFEDIDAVEFVDTSIDNSGTWYNVENARIWWDDLIGMGYNRVEKS